MCASCRDNIRCIKSRFSIKIQFYGVKSDTTKKEAYERRAGLTGVDKTKAEGSMDNRFWADDNRTEKSKPIKSKTHWSQNLLQVMLASMKSENGPLLNFDLRAKQVSEA